MTHFNTNRKVVLFIGFEIEGMIDFDVRPREPIVLPLLEVESVVLIGLCRGPSYKSIENNRIPFYPRAGWLIHSREK
jgi:hypothetical protein